MDPKNFAGMVEALITVAAGVVCLLTASGVIGGKKGVDAAHDQKMEKLGPILKFGGLFLIVWGVVRLFLAFANHTV